MADSKKYDGSQWEHSLRKQTTASEIIVPPTTIYADGSNITTYSIKGNTVQNGTPTPSNPVAVNGVGDKTANLLNVSQTNALFYTDYPASTYNHFTINNGVITFEGSQAAMFYFLAKVEQNTKYYYRISTSDAVTVRIRNYSDVPSTRSANCISTSFNSQIKGIFRRNYTTPENTQYVAIEFYHDPSESEETAFNIMVSATDSTYEPYGYKIPISSGQGSAVNYLGSVQSNRQIKKLVLTGEETVVGSAVAGGWIITQLSDSINNTAGVQTAYCSHYEAKENGSMSGLSNGEMCISTQYNNRINFVTSFSSATDFQVYLAQQYANGTPVTVWYVLATAETAAVNEPLMKIGDYADSISNAASIPTTDGANSITVDTTVQPSEFSATWTGWHDSSVKEWDGTDWQ